jgi:hypothetical protein
MLRTERAAAAAAAAAATTEVVGNQVRSDRAAVEGIELQQQERGRNGPVL